MCREDPDQAAIINRAIQGQYNMGSTFKVFVAWAALNTGTRGRATGSTTRARSESTSIEDDVCATGVKCEWRNSFCSASNGPCVYGNINMYYSLAVSSDVYYYQLGEQMYLTPGTDHRLLQDQVATVRIRDRPADRSAVRVRRPPPISGDQGGPHRQRGARRERGTKGPRRRRHQPRDRPGPARRLADAARGRIRRLRQRWLRHAAPRGPAHPAPEHAGSSGRRATATPPASSR